MPDQTLKGIAVKVLEMFTHLLKTNQHKTCSECISVSESTMAGSEVVGVVFVSKVESEIYVLLTSHAQA